MNAREEEAKKSKNEQVKRRQNEAEEEAIKDAGRRMLEEAQRRALAAQTKLSTTAKSQSHIPPTNGHTPPFPDNGPTKESKNQAPPPITSEELTLILNFPSTSTSSTSNTASSSSSSSSTLQSTLQNRYGPINFVHLRDPPLSESGTNKKRKKGRKAIVEFKNGNWGGCWACWRDHDDESVKEQRGTKPIEEGVKAKWLKGQIPDWIEWANRQRNGHHRHGSGHDTISDIKLDQTHPSPSFGSAPDFGQMTMADLLAQNHRTKETIGQVRQKDEEFESMTLLRMRQMERDRLAEQIRREEEEIIE